jgi:flagellar biosynthesis GTPase FlhF
MVNAVMASDLPISFITMGQRVPEDITRPRPQAIARRIAESVLEFAGPSVGRTVETQEDQLTRLAG